MSEKELKPCRCECGKKPALYWTTKRAENRWRVACDCGRSGPYNYVSRDSAIIHWNTRPPAVPVETGNMEDMAAWVVSVCEKRGWSSHWTHRGAYLHLESSELIEAIRGKHGDPTDEAGDVLLVLMSITEYAGIPFSNVIRAAQRKLDYLEDAPPYAGEECTAQAEADHG